MEVQSGETRVALTPANVAALITLGAAVRVEHNAGRSAGFTDNLYEAAGAEVVPCPGAIWTADVVVKVAGPTPDEAVSLEDRHLVSKTPEWYLIPSLVKQGATVVSLTLLIQDLYSEDSVDFASSRILGNAASKLLTTSMSDNRGLFTVDLGDRTTARTCLAHSFQRVDPVVVQPLQSADTLRTRQLSHFIKRFA